MQSRVETITAPNGATVELATVTFEGRDFTALGACVSGERLACYMAKPDNGAAERVGARGDVTDWQGKRIGRYEITARWPTPRSWVSSHMCQCVVKLDNGANYSGCGTGAGMLWRGKRKAR